MTKPDAQARKRALMSRIQTDGSEAAYEALLAVCRDAKAPAPARATAATSLFRAAGLMNGKQDAQDKPPEEMSLAEIEARIAELRSREAGENDHDDLEADRDDDGGDEKTQDLFG